MRFIRGHRGKNGGHDNLCSVPGCGHKRHTQGYCPVHYYRWLTYGDPEQLLRRELPLVERFWTYVVKTAGDCWEWSGGHTGDGYSCFSVSREEAYPAHRFAYELVVGPVPEGLELDHLCRNPGCVNPAHLEPVTHDENMKRADNANGTRSAATHCPKGHPYDRENTIHRNGRRHCKACAKEKR